MTPFDIFEKDIDDFILLCNYLVDLENKETEPKSDKQEADAFWALL